MRALRTLAAFVALATVAFAVGDFASHPNALGAVGLLVMIAVFALLLSYLFRPAKAPAAPPPAPVEPEPEPRRRAKQPVWSGWNADEAERARERRRGKS